MPPPPPPPPPRVFYQQLRLAMALRRLNATALAKAVNVDPKTVGNWLRDSDDQEQTEPKASDLNAICTALGVSADYLLGRATDPSGLSPGTWIIDEDLLVVAKTDVGADVEPSIKVPRKPRVVDDATHKGILAEIAESRKALKRKGAP